MCGASLLYRVQRCLQDIKKPANPDSRFGDVTVIGENTIIPKTGITSHSFWTTL